MKKNLINAMQLASKNLLTSLNKDCNYLPFWLMEVSEDYRGHFHFYRSVHNIGRWWDALVRLEAATDFQIPADLEAAMLQNLKSYYENEDHICTEPEEIKTDPPIPFDLHSLREGLLALCALIQRRPQHRDWALDTAHKMLQTVDRLVLLDGTIDMQTLDYIRKYPDRVYHETPTHCHGRFIEPLVYYYQLSNDSLAYQLAERLSEWHYLHSTNEAGTLEGLVEIDHAHSYMGTLRGLYLFGKLSGNTAYQERVRLSYRNTVLGYIVKASGFAPHDIGAESRPEPATVGDAAQLALWFALDGYPEYLDDAERFVRSRMLPSIIWDSPAISPDGEGTHDRWADLSQRIIGAVGGVQTHPHGGKCAITDVTASCLHTFTDIYNHICIESDDLVQVLFHFDYTCPFLQQTSHREGNRAFLTLEYSGAKRLQIRIPAWTNWNDVTLSINGQSICPTFVGTFLQIESPDTPVQICVEYSLPQQDIVETLAGTDYHIRFLGDEIIGITPNVDFFPLYPTLEIEPNI